MQKVFNGEGREKLSEIIVYFSGTGNNQKIAIEISRLKGIYISKIEDNSKRNFFKDSFYALTKKNVPFTLSREIGEEFTHIYLVTPVWAGHLPAPVASFLRKFSENLKKSEITLISVSGFGEKNAKIVEQIYKIAGTKPKASLFLRDSELKSGEYAQKLENFLQKEKI
uniref:Flavodoxin-like domain-containing protein n=1 Tax=candidate division WOR-3 bacterium TaxID=2052148 RepID=A0A7C2P202_UNCW3